MVNAFLRFPHAGVMNLVFAAAVDHTDAVLVLIGVMFTAACSLVGLVVTSRIKRDTRTIGTDTAATAGAVNHTSEGDPTLRELVQRIDAKVDTNRAVTDAAIAGAQAAVHETRRAVTLMGTALEQLSAAVRGDG